MTSTTATTNDNNNASSSAYMTLDGSYGEGGGQILRNSISYATLLGIPLRIENIRAGRSKPGLKAQHCASVELPARIVQGILQGSVLHSSCIVYTPPDSNSNNTSSLAADDTYMERNLTQNIGTAGSICLLLQAALPVALFASAPTHLTLGGGTNATLAPQYDYWYEVFLPTLQRHFHVTGIQAHVVQRGYFPKGGGQVQVHVQRPLTVQESLPPLQLTDRGDNVTTIRIRAFHAGRWKRQQAQDMVDAAHDFLQHHQPDWMTTIRVDTEIVTERQAVGSGMGLLLVATTSTGCLLAGSALCDMKKMDGPAAGRSAANELVQTWMDGGCVDEWLQDQCILYMALADGTSRMLTGSLTLHTQTAIWVAEQLTGARFQVERLDDNVNNTQNHKERLKSSRPPPNADYGTHGRMSGRHLITCTGIGLKGRAPE